MENYHSPKKAGTGPVSNTLGACIDKLWRDQSCASYCLEEAPECAKRTRVSGSSPRSMGVLEGSSSPYGGEAVDRAAAA
uniref:Uncharacterized protein n=1 Tax=Arundo donax TaxID=35708 RepID=A0A0A9GEP0_ARUDO